VVVPQDGVAATLPIVITGPTGTPTVTFNGLPKGVTAQFAVGSAAPSGTLTFTGGASIPAGTYSPTLTVTLGGQSETQGFTLISGVVAKVG
jgi:hypothetical protein